MYVVPYNAMPTYSIKRGPRDYGNVVAPFARRESSNWSLVSDRADVVFGASAEGKVLLTNRSLDILLDKYKVQNDVLIDSPYYVPSYTIEEWMALPSHDGMWFFKPNDGYIGSGNLITFGSYDTIMDAIKERPLTFTVGKADPFTIADWVIQPQMISIPHRNISRGHAWDCRHFAIVVQGPSPCVFTSELSAARVAVSKYDPNNQETAITNISIQEKLSGYNSSTHLVSYEDKRLVDLIKTVFERIPVCGKTSVEILGFDTIITEDGPKLLEVNRSPFLSSANTVDAEGKLVFQVWNVLFQHALLRALGSTMVKSLPKGWVEFSLKEFEFTKPPPREMATIAKLQAEIDRLTKLIERIRVNEKKAVDQYNDSLDELDAKDAEIEELKAQIGNTSDDQVAMLKAENQKLRTFIEGGVLQGVKFEPR